jgi:hypothetical protein
MAGGGRTCAWLLLREGERGLAPVSQGSMALRGACGTVAWQAHQLLLLLVDSVCLVWCQASSGHRVCGNPCICRMRNPRAPLQVAARERYCARAIDALPLARSQTVSSRSEWMGP